MSDGNSANQKYIACLGDISITEYDIDTLSKPYNWVNDAVIHIFGRMIEKNINESDSNAKKKILFVAPCTVQFIRFFEFEDAVKDCVQNLKIDNFEVVFFPITNGTSFTSRGNHWSLIIYLTSENKFLYCDSIYSHRDIPMAQSLIKKLELFLNLPKADFLDTDLPGQTNSYDCGVFIMAYMEYFAKNGSFNNIDNYIHQQNMSELRKNYSQQIKNAGFDNQT